jgi:hypothetical protein
MHILMYNCRLLNQTQQRVYQRGRDCLHLNKKFAKCFCNVAQGHARVPIAFGQTLQVLGHSLRPLLSMTVGNGQQTSSQSFWHVQIRCTETVPYCSEKMTLRTPDTAAACHQARFR